MEVGGGGWESLLLFGHLRDRVVEELFSFNHLPSSDLVFCRAKLSPRRLRRHFAFARWALGMIMEDLLSPKFMMPPSKVYTELYLWWFKGSVKPRHWTCWNRPSSFITAHWDRCCSMIGPITGRQPVRSSVLSLALSTLQRIISWWIHLKAGD